MFGGKNNFWGPHGYMPGKILKKRPVKQKYSLVTSDGDSDVVLLLYVYTRSSSITLIVCHSVYWCTLYNVLQTAQH